MILCAKFHTFRHIYIKKRDYDFPMEIDDVLQNTVPENIFKNKI